MVGDLFESQEICLVLMTGNDYLRLTLEAYMCSRQTKKKFPRRLFQLLKNFPYSNTTQYSYPKVDDKI
jgi:hypothetical protein